MRKPSDLLLEGVALGALVGNGIAHLSEWMPWNQGHRIRWEWALFTILGAVVILLWDFHRLRRREREPLP
jgi:hypothetical protein